MPHSLLCPRAPNLVLPDPPLALRELAGARLGWAPSFPRLSPQRRHATPNAHGLLLPLQPQQAAASEWTEDTAFLPLGPLPRTTFPHTCV